MKKKIAIINGQPNPESYNHSLQQAYIEGAQQSGAEISVIEISKLKFDPNLAYGYSKRMNLEPDLEKAINAIKNADHTVWIHPIWWYGIPAQMKGFIDRTFLPGITFKSHPDKAFPEQLLKGKTARIITTSDTPLWYYSLWMKSPAKNQLKKGVLEFCGVKPVKTTYIAPIKNSTEDFRKQWIEKVRKIGMELR